MCVLFLLLFKCKKQGNFRYFLINACQCLDKMVTTLYYYLELKIYYIKT
jgi:hypothetical protein